MTKKTPNPIDVHVGNRVRMRRMLIGMSQEKLGEKLGLTFQQIQKYEKGTNRISASRLYQISQILGVPVQFFFEDLPQQSGGEGEGLQEAGEEGTIMDFLGSSEGLQLNRYFSRIQDANVRRSIVDLVRTLAREGA
jgi:transcriptional regulator with XRE-family HTH domain